MTSDGRPREDEFSSSARRFRLQCLPAGDDQREWAGGRMPSHRPDRRDEAFCQRLRVGLLDLMDTTRPGAQDFQQNFRAIRVVAPEALLRLLRAQ